MGIGVRWRRATAAAVAAVVSCVGVGGAAAEMVFHRGNDGDLSSLDPHKITGDWENRIIGDLFEGLITEDAHARPIPGQAKSWEISEDRRVYTFTLREDARWSNGDQVTAYDFEFAFQRALDPRTGAQYASLFYPIAGAEEFNSGRSRHRYAVGVKALGPVTLLVILSHPTAHFLAQLKHFSAFPVPRRLIARAGDRWTDPRQFISNGPYRLAERVPQSRVTLVKNPHYYDADAVRIDRVVYHTIEDPAQGVLRFRAGEVDLFPDFPSSQYRWLADNLPDQTRVAPFLGTYYYTLNLSRQALADVRVRRALALVIDRRIITDRIRGVGEAPATGLVPPGTRDYEAARVDFADRPMAERIAEAQALMAAAGYSRETPLSVTLSFNVGENHRKIAIAAAAMWSERLPVTVELKSQEVAVHYQNLQQRSYDIGRAGWVADYNDAQSFLYLGESSAGPVNYAGYRNPDYDLVMDEAAAAGLDRDRRAGLLRDAEAMLLRDLPYIPLYYYVSLNLVSTALKGYEDNVEDIHRTRWMWLERP